MTGSAKQSIPSLCRNMNCFRLRSLSYRGQVACTRNDGRRRVLRSRVRDTRKEYAQEYRTVLIRIGCTRTVHL
jgi:hypothetical protein